MTQYETHYEDMIRMIANECRNDVILVKHIVALIAKTTDQINTDYIYSELEKSGSIFVHNNPIVGWIDEKPIRRLDLYYHFKNVVRKAMSHTTIQQERDYIYHEILEMKYMNLESIRLGC